MEWIKRLFCLHLNWVETGLILGFYDELVCVKCGKKKFFEFNNHPVNYLPQEQED